MMKIIIATVFAGLIVAIITNKYIDTQAIQGVGPNSIASSTELYTYEKAVEFCERNKLNLVKYEVYKKRKYIFLQEMYKEGCYWTGSIYGKNTERRYVVNPSHDIPGYRTITLPENRCYALCSHTLYPEDIVNPKINQPAECNEPYDFMCSE